MLHWKNFNLHANLLMKDGFKRREKVYLDMRQKAFISGINNVYYLLMLEQKTGVLPLYKDELF